VFENNEHFEFLKKKGGPQLFSAVWAGLSSEWCGLQCIYRALSKTSKIIGYYCKSLVLTRKAELAGFRNFQQAVVSLLFETELQARARCNNYYTIISTRNIFVMVGYNCFIIFNIII
jgi:hypothetical protein